MSHNHSDVILETFRNWEVRPQIATALRPPCESCGAPTGCKVAVHFPIEPQRCRATDQLECSHCGADARHLDPEYVVPERVFVDYLGRVVSDRFEGDCEL